MVRVLIRKLYVLNTRRQRFLLDTIVPMVRLLYVGPTYKYVRTNIASGSDNFTHLH